jgi:hypothetical protein
LVCCLADTAVAFGIDSMKTPYLRENGASSVLAGISCPVLLFIVAKRTVGTNYSKEEGLGIPIRVRLEHENAVAINGEVVAERGMGVLLLKALLEWRKRRRK